MNFKKPMLIAGVATTVALASLAGASVVSAAPPHNDQDRTEHHARMERRQNAKLDQLVKDGKITSAQKDLIVAKHAELRKNMEANRDKTARDAKKTELEKWTSDNGINLEYVQPLGHGGHHGGPDGPM